MTFEIYNKKFYFKLYDNDRHIHKDLDKSKFIIAVDREYIKQGVKNIVKAYTNFDNLTEIRKFINKCSQNKRNLYEYRKIKQPFKPFFDLDFEIKEKKECEIPINLIENFTECLKLSFLILFDIKLLDKDIFIYESCTSIKLSYHIVLPFYYMDDIDIMKKLRNYVDMRLRNKYKYDYFFNLPNTCVDNSIYNKSGQFRLLHCCKIGKNNFKKPYLDTPPSFKLSLITNIYTNAILINSFHEEVFEEDIIEEKIEEAQFSGNKDIGDNIIKFILDNLNISRTENYDEWRNIGFCLFNSNIDFEWFDYFSQRCEEKYNGDDVLKFWDTLKNGSSPDKKLKYGSLLYYLKKDNLKAFMSLKNIDGFSKKITHHFENFFNLDQIEKSDKLDIEIFEEQYINFKRFERNSDILVQSYLGTGKTECLSKLDEIQNQRYNILILTNRRKLAQEFSKRFRWDTHNINCYLNYDKNKHNDTFFNRCIIQPESLWKVPPTIHYDLLIIDECESVFSQFTSTTMKTSEFERGYNNSIIDGEKFDRHTEFSIRWEKLTNKTKKIIFADAFLSKRTVDMYNGLSRNGVLLINKFKPQQREAIHIPIQKIKDSKAESIQPLINKALEELKNNKNIFIVCSSISKMNDFLTAFNKYNFIGKAYNSKINAGKLLKFDCDEWKNCQYVIITTTITTGINFNFEHFDSVFVYFQSTPLVRDLFQSIMRVRQLRENKLYFSISNHVFGDKFLSSNPSIAEIKNEIRNRGIFIKENLSTINISTIESLITIAAYNKFERSCQSYDNTYKKIINTFFDMCNYKIINNENIEEEIESEDIKEIVDDNYDIIFDMVINITVNEIDIIKDNIDRGLEGDLDKEILCMDYFMKKFNIDRKIPDLKKRFYSIYYLLRKNPELKAQASRNTNFLNGSWYDPTINLTIDNTNPKIGELCKYYVMHKICEDMKMTYSKDEAEIISKETVQNFSPQLLNKWAVHYFKMKDKKKIDGKNIYINPEYITPKDNIRYINYIFLSFGDSKLKHTEKMVKKMNGKTVDVTPYHLEFSNFMHTLFNLQKNKRGDATMSDHLKLFFENEINS